MIKEILLAITLGALLGFGITGGYIAINKEKVSATVVSVSPTPTNNNPSNPNDTPTPITDSTDTNTHQLTIESPENETIIANSQTSIKGTTSPQSSLIVTTPVNTYYTTADNAGNFNLNIEVESGVNSIQIDSIDSSDNQASTQLIITYSTAKI
jgi:hypothetical protein